MSLGLIQAWCCVVKAWVSALLAVDAQRLSRGPKNVSRRTDSPISDFYGQPENKPKIEITSSFPRRRESKPLLDSRLRRNDGATVKPRIVSPGPLEGAEQRRNAGAFGWRCLSRRRVLPAARRFE